MGWVTGKAILYGDFRPDDGEEDDTGGVELQGGVSKRSS